MWEIKLGHTVVVPAAPIVYVLGEVEKPGGYILGSDRELLFLLPIRR